MHYQPAATIQITYKLVEIKFVANDRIPAFLEKLEQEGVAFKTEWIKNQQSLEKQATT